MVWWGAEKTEFEAKSDSNKNADGSGKYACKAPKVCTHPLLHAARLGSRRRDDGMATAAARRVASGLGIPGAGGPGLPAPSGRRPAPDPRKAAKTGGECIPPKPPAGIKVPSAPRFASEHIWIVLGVAV